MKMKFYVIIAIGMMLLCMAEAESRRKITLGKKLLDPQIEQNSTAETDKGSEKTNYPKKALSLKKRPTKTPSISITGSTNSVEIMKDTKDVTDIFKDLPSDDLEFIKELDMQFKLHGDKIKIRVEHDNATALSKNSKRTIEHDLGYGYNHNGYTYDKPKFIFYPYSQKDIPPSAPGYFPQFADSQDVKVEPSYSYELKPQTYVIQHDHSTPQIDIPHPQEPQEVAPPEPQAHQEGAQEPVIILRIPGPTKYASHLQSLLQQYLEIRAAQYLRILQEAESRRQQEYHQQYIVDSNDQQHLHQQYQHLPPQTQHVDPQSAAPHTYMSDSHHSQLTATEQQQHQPQHSYPPIDDVYQTYKQRQRYQQQAYMEHQHDQQYNGQQNSASHEFSPYEVANEPQKFYYPNEQQQNQGHPQGAYQQILVYEMVPPVYSNEENHIASHHLRYPKLQIPIYVQEENSQYDNQNNDQTQSGHLDTNENNPRSTHTKVIFTQNTDSSSSDHASSYPLPSIRPYERHVPTSSQLYHQTYQQKNELDPSHQQAVAESSPPQKTAEITPRPFNYHAHPPKSRNSSGYKRAVSTIKAAPSKSAPIKAHEHTGQQLKQIAHYIRENRDALKTVSATQIKPVAKG